jgi:phosphatidylglycerophosphate synthase
LAAGAFDQHDRTTTTTKGGRFSMPSTREVIHGRGAELGPALPALSPPVAVAATGAVLAGILAVIVRLFEFGTVTAVGALGGYVLLSAVVLARFRAADASTGFGLANTITLVRGALNCLLLGLLLQPAALAAAWGEAAGWSFVAVAVASLALDGVDGRVARRWRLASPFGARFDVEVDALLSSVLALAAVVLGKVGPWVTAIALAYYGFVAARRAWPWLARPLPPSFRRKTVFVAQAAGLVVIVAPPVSAVTATWLAAAILTLMLASFAYDVRWLYRQAARVPAPAGRSSRHG